MMAVVVEVVVVVQEFCSTCVFLSPNSPTTRCAAVSCVSVGLRCRRRLFDDLDDAVDDAFEPFFCDINDNTS